MIDYAQAQERVAALPNNRRLVAALPTLARAPAAPGDHTTTSAPLTFTHKMGEMRPIDMRVPFADVRAATDATLHLRGLVQHTWRMATTRDKLHSLVTPR